MDNYRIDILKSGLRLVTVPMPQVESVTVVVGVGAGSRYEERKTNGLAHFLEHMTLKGTKKRPSSLAISSEVDAVGGEFNAFTDKELTGYWIKVAAKHTKLALDILADILTNSLLKTEEINREKGVIIEEINMREDTPMIHIWEVFTRLLYGDNPMGWDTAGERETVRGINRDDFLHYINAYYFSKNMTVVVAGKINELETRFLTERFFTLFPKGGQKITKTIKVIQDSPRLKLVSKKTEQAHFCLGLPGLDLFHPDRYALGVITTILGGGMSSRLFIKIRERRGLAYYVDCSPEYYTDSGYLVASAGVRIEKIEEAIKIILGELTDLTSKKVKNKELSKAKEFNKGRFILALEDSRNVASRAATQLILENRVRTVRETLRLIDAVTAENILRVAKNLFKPERLNLAVIGPYQEENKFKRLLKI